MGIIMKYILAALFAAVSAESPDCPESTQVFSYNERVPVATGFVQVDTACARTDIEGVRCAPANSKLFATGMNGDEDLGEDIQMKGEKFHYQQKPENHQLFATGMNGDEDLGEDITMKGEKFHYTQKPQNKKLFATGMNGDEDLGEDITMKGEKFHYG